MLKYKTVRQISTYEWDEFVKKTYGKKYYSIQQQDGCRDRQNITITVPSKHAEDYDRDIVPFEVNGEVMGVSLKAWIERDDSILEPFESKSSLGLWWDRNFYPDEGVIANDLYERGLLEAGTYDIVIGW